MWPCAPMMLKVPDAWPAPGAGPWPAVPRTPPLTLSWPLLVPAHFLNAEQCAAMAILHYPHPPSTHPPHTAAFVAPDPNPKILLRAPTCAG